MSLYKQFKTNDKLESDGILLQYGLDSKGQPVVIRVARAGPGNTKFQKLLDRKLKPFRRQLQMESADEKVIEKVLIEVYAETIVLGWENVEDEKGLPILFNKANCIKLFNDLPDLFADVRDQAMKSSLFRAEILEGDAGN
jgi:hypothetical protein